MRRKRIPRMVCVPVVCASVSFLLVKGVVVDVVPVWLLGGF